MSSSCIACLSLIAAPWHASTHMCHPHPPTIFRCTLIHTQEQVTLTGCQVLLSVSCRWLIQDTLKVLTYKLLYAFDIFQIKSGSFMGKAGHAPGTEHLLGIRVCL